MSQFFMLMLVVILVCIVFFLIVILIDSNRFRVVEYSLSSNKIEKKHQFVVLSDLHNKTYGKKNEKLLKKIDELQPEAIFIAGDLIISKPGKSCQTAVELVQSLRKKYPLYYGMGNHEARLFLYPEVYGDMGKDYEEALEKLQVRILKNESLEEEDNLRIIGLDMEKKYYKRFGKMVMEDDYLRKTLGEGTKEKYQILLAHNPDYFEEYAKWGADLVLAGHIHGGIVRLPFLGGVISPSLRLFPKYDGGFFQQGTSVMVLSRGLGMHTIPIRMFNPGELICLTLTPEEV